MTSVSLPVELVRDRERAITSLGLAFSKDPVARWAYPEAADYLDHFTEFMRLFGGRAFDHGTAYCTKAYAGVALWLPPGVHPDGDAIVALLEATVADSRRDRVFEVLEQMAGYHPEEPHWYLPLLGVDPLYQGKGHGSALLEYVLAECDRSGKVAYLESTNAANLPLYQRHGFELVGQIQVGEMPPLWPMVRRPR